MHIYAPLILQEEIANNLQENVQWKSYDFLKMISQKANHYL